MDVFLAAGVEVDFARLTRHVYAASGCGLCGKATIDAVRQNFPRRIFRKISVATLLRLPKRCTARRLRLLRPVGYAAAVFDLRGQLVALRGILARHNAVTKSSVTDFWRRTSLFRARVVGERTRFVGDHAKVIGGAYPDCLCRVRAVIVGGGIPAKLAARRLSASARQNAERLCRRGANQVRSPFCEKIKMSVAKSIFVNSLFIGLLVLVSGWDGFKPQR